MCDLRVCHLLGTRWVLLFCSPLHLLCPWKTRTPIFVRIRTNVALTIKRGKTHIRRTRFNVLFVSLRGGALCHTHNLLLNRVHHFHARSSHRMSSSYKLLNRRVMDPSGASKEWKSRHTLLHTVYSIFLLYIPHMCTTFFFLCFVKSVLW